MISAHLPHLSITSFHILLSLRCGPLHGYGIIRRVSEDTAGRVRLLTGSLYNALKRLQHDGLIEERVDPTHQRRMYVLTQAGIELVLAETERYSAVLSLKDLGKLRSGDVA